MTDLTQPPSRKRSKAQLLANAKSEKRTRANEKSVNKSNKLSKAEQSSGSDNDVDCDSSDETNTPGGDESHGGYDSERPEMNAGGLRCCFLRT